MKSAEHKKALSRIREARYRAKHREKLRRAGRERYNKIRAVFGVCEICNSQNVKLYKDHSHLTGIQRGLICNNCNLILGHAKDSLETLRKAIEYLERYSSVSPRGELVSSLDVGVALS